MTDSQVQRGIYNCPNCGAAAAPDSVRCAYCHSSLATLVCSSCFGAIFIGMKHCPWCGAEASAGKPVEAAVGQCPRCNLDLLALKVGNKRLFECRACGGLWADKDTLQQICTDREQQQAVMGFDFGQDAGTAAKPGAHERAYIPCPACRKLMNRRNFAGCSGVIVDWCKDHGTWFDRDELRQVVQFILGGGLAKSRDLEKSKLQEERLHVQEEERNLTRISRLAGPGSSEDHRGHDSDLFNLLAGIWRNLRD